ncbi:hypothetical protein [Micromonospora endophytica]|uniref:Uncharacterized protein n=1 Tax=Micromonospora endophytica TaxID=515350 RepID=A0A2W2BMT3_9ACTN|nr:hypothetical protein [Micromonospora endophytica]PZF86590.1 hypothetical protein C1I93_27560 [Micromonospora endophytica]RIW46010.1 hypothetical protein D3H59_13390 [Micromonospora endophytica]BCJ60239.1 hypothetical protein Jiend_36610 [Micromonospora endophytica]
MQLHEVVDAVTADEPPLARSADDIIAAGRRAERRRRAGFASAGAAGLVVVAVAGAFALTSVTSSTSAPLALPDQSAGIVAGAGQPEVTWSDAAPFNFTFRGFTAGRFRVEDPIVASTAYQIARVYQTDRVTTELPKNVRKDLPAGKGKRVSGAHFAHLTLYRPGAFDPAGITDGTPLTVAGRQAISSAATNPPNQQLAWEYADNAWAVVTAFSYDADPSVEDLSALVTALKPSPAVPAKLPFRVGELPAGYTPVEIGTNAIPGLNGIAAPGDSYGGATYANPAPATTGLTKPYGGDDGEAIPSSFSIFVTPSAKSNQTPKPGKTECFPQSSTPFCNVYSADGVVQVQVVGTGQFSSTELTRIAKSVEVVDVTDEAAWIPAAEALTAR